MLRGARGQQQTTLLLLPSKAGAAEVARREVLQ